MAMSAASRPFTVKGTRWMCTVWFVAFLLRQRGWAWVFTATNVRRAVRMAAPHRGSMPVVLPRGDGVALCLPLDRCRSCVGCRLPICQACVMELEHLSSSRKPSLEPDLQAVGDAVGGLDAMSLVLCSLLVLAGIFICRI